MEEIKLFLTDIIKKAGINPERVKLIRHSRDKPEFKKCKENKLVKLYTSFQIKGFSDEFDYWMVFISGKGTTAIFHSF